MTRLSELAELREGWDGPGSQPIHPRALAAYVALAAQFNGRLPAELEPMATFDGGLRLEWDRGEDSYATELDPDGGLYLCHVGADEAAGDHREYPRFDPALWRRFYDTGRFETP